MSTHATIHKRGLALWALASLAALGVALALWGPRLASHRATAPADLPAAATAEWWSQVTAGIAAEEYEVTPSDLGPQAPNRRQNLRTYFREDGIEVMPRVEGAAAWTWGWQTQAWGRPGALAPVSACAPVIDAMRIEYPHAHLTEWYENGPGGIEQGFSVPLRPSGSGPLLITGALSGTLAAATTDDGRGVDFRTPVGCPVLRYDGLKVSDARGAALPASIDLADGAITIRVDDADAVYPILIDPLLTTPSWTGDGDADRVGFGQVVATAGDVNGDGYSDVLISAPYYSSYGLANNGRVFAYYGSASGLPLTADWNKSGDQMNGFLGQKLGPAGDVNGDGYDDVIVASQNYAHGESYEGRVWLYYGSADGLEETWIWDYEGNQVNAYCGFAVGTAGDVNKDGFADVFVSAEGYSNGQTDEGVVWVFHGSAGGLGDTPDWTGEANNANCGFGSSASTAGDVDGDGYADLVISAPNYENPSGTFGRVYVYYGSSTGIAGTPWIEESTETDFEHFGYAVAGAGDVNGDGYADILVGAPSFSGDITLEGIVYLYRGSETGPLASPAWDAQGNQNNCYWGRAVGTAGDVNGDGYADIVVGAEAWHGTLADEGRARMYLGHATWPNYDPDWSVDGGQLEAAFGTSVGTAGDVNGDGLSEIIVGAPDYDSGNTDEGQAFVYHGVADAPQLLWGAFLQSDQPYARAGGSLAAAGDVNGDGYSDVLIGADSYDHGEADEGVIFLFLGSFQGLATAPAWYAESNQESAFFGSVGYAGDVNGDGLCDVLAGAPYYDGAHQDEGAAFVWYGAESAPMGNPANAAWSATGGQAGACFGYSVAGAGDVNGDGYADIIVGADLYDDGQLDEGAAFAFHGSADGPSATWDWYRDSDLAGAEFGYCVATAGDFNGDGYSDVIVGTFKYDHPDTDEGLASVYNGSAVGLTNGAPFWYAQGDEAEAWLGYSVGCAGDINGDGYSDVIIGAPQLTTTEDNGGKALVWYGGPTAPPTGNPSNADWSVQRNKAGARLGWCVGTAGDVNNDGYSDVLISTPYPAGEGDAFGAAFIYFGSSAGVGPICDWIVEGPTSSAAFAATSAYVGDVNGDGFGDVMIGASLWDSGEWDEGGVFLYYGNNGPGLNRAPMQWQADYADPIAPLGLSENTDRFALRGMGRTPAGRGAVRMVWEVKDFLDPFDGTGLGYSSWTNTGAPLPPAGSRVLIARVISGLTPGSLPHWRIRFEAQNPYFPRGPWLHQPGNAAGEADLRLGQTSAVDPVTGTEASLFLAPCVPNPMLERGVIRYALPEAGSVRLAVYDVEGRQVTVLVDEPQQDAGTHTVTWDGLRGSGARVTPGVYFCRIEAAGAVRTERILVAR